MLGFFLPSFVRMTAVRVGRDDHGSCGPAERMRRLAGAWGREKEL